MRRCCHALLTCYWVLLCGLFHATPLPALGAELSTDEADLLAVVAEKNRLNRSNLDAFDARYETIIIDWAGEGDPERIIEKHGRIAFSGSRLYSEENIAESEYQLVYVENGNTAKAASRENPRLILMGRTSNDRLRKGGAAPWEIFWGDISSRIDALAVEEGVVNSVAHIEEAGSEYIVVNVHVPSQSLGGDQPGELVLRYSVDQDYAPTEFRLSGTTPNGEVVVSGGTDKHLRYLADGGTGVLPLDYVEETWLNGNKVRELRWSMHEETVQIDPQLEDALFEIEIQDGDQVINVDLDLELLNPFGRNLLGSMDIQMQPNHTLEQGQQYARHAEPTAASSATGEEGHDSFDEAEVHSGGAMHWWYWMAVCVLLLGGVIGVTVLLRRR